MARFVTSVKTSLSQQEAFDYMTDLRNLAEWDPGVSSSEIVGDGEVDEDVLDWFRGLGPRYQTRMNAVLRAYMRRSTAPSRAAKSRSR